MKQLSSLLSLEVKISRKVKIKIQKKSFNVDRENKFLLKNNTGAIVNFVGTVRVKDKNNKNILSMTLEHYPVMTENEILKITEKALKKWDINYISIIHRIGKLFPKDKIVYVGVSSKHRQNAFNACNFIMDYLKSNATFWKLEEFENKNKWVIQDKKEIAALEKWS